MNRMTAVLVALSLGGTLMSAQQNTGPSHRLSAYGWTVSHDTDSFSGVVATNLSVNSEERNASLSVLCPNGYPVVVLAQTIGIYDYNIETTNRTVAMRVRVNDGTPETTIWTVSENARYALQMGRDGPPFVSGLTTTAKLAVQLNIYNLGYETATFLMPNPQVVQEWLSGCHPAPRQPHGDARELRPGERRPLTERP
jgi:hypothetical protein